MLNMTYEGENTVHKIEFDKKSKNIVSVKGTLPAQTNGFMLSRENKKDKWDYRDYTTIYRVLDGEIQFSNDGSVYVESVPKVRFYNSGGGTLDGETVQEVKNYEDLKIPTPVAGENYEFTHWNPEIPTQGKIESDVRFVAYFVYVPPLNEVQEAKVMEMNSIQQQMIQQGLDIVLTDGTTEHFTLTDHDQTSLMGLQTKVAEGAEQIPWHTSDQTEHCKYYSNADMAVITSKALEFVTFHVTYFRDIRIFIRALQEKEDVQNVTYGMYIPEEYQSDVLKDMYAVMQEE